MDTLVYNGKAFAEFNTFFDGSKAFNTGEKDYEFYEILGRNGSLSSFNGRFKDVNLVFPCFIRHNFIQNYRSLEAFLNSTEGYLRLETSKEPNHYRKALFQGVVDPTTTPFNHGGFFTIEFKSHPQRWLKSGENWVSFDADGSIFNPTLQTARPIIRIYGTGSVMIGSQTITVTTAGTNYIDLDCETMDAYEGAYNRNANIETGFEQIGLHAGNNGITLDGVTIEIMPRWFEI